MIERQLLKRETCQTDIVQVLHDPKGKTYGHCTGFRYTHRRVPPLSLAVVLITIYRTLRHVNITAFGSRRLAEDQCGEH